MTDKVEFSTRDATWYVTQAVAENATEVATWATIRRELADVQ